MFALPNLIEPLFTIAGWKSKKRTESATEVGISAQDRVRDILDEFGGLRVGQSGPGTEQAASDVHFYLTPRPEVSFVTSPWNAKIGRSAAFATAHNDHMILFVNDEGTYFIFTGPDERLYRAGNSFGELMQTLLWGYRYEPPLARDA